MDAPCIEFFNAGRQSTSLCHILLSLTVNVQLSVTCVIRTYSVAYIFNGLFLRVQYKSLVDIRRRRFLLGRRQT